MYSPPPHHTTPHHTTPHHTTPHHTTPHHTTPHHTTPHHTTPHHTTPHHPPYTSITTTTAHLAHTTPPNTTNQPRKNTQNKINSFQLQHILSFLVTTSLCQDWGSSRACCLPETWWPSLRLPLQIRTLILWVPSLPWRANTLPSKADRSET